MTAKQKGFIGVAVGLLLLLIFGKKSTGQAVPTSNAGLLQGTLIGQKTLFPVSTKPAFGGVGVGSLASSAGSGASMLVLPKQSKPGIPVNSQGGLMLNYLEVAPSKTSIVLEPIAKKISVEPIAKQLKISKGLIGVETNSPGLSIAGPCKTC